MAKLVWITLALTACLLTRTEPAAAQPASADADRLQRVRQQWIGIRAAWRRYPWQKAASRVNPKLSAPELRQLGRIARMPHISVSDDRIVGANDAYYQSARVGRPLPGSRMVSLELNRNGLPCSRTVRGGVTKLRQPWGDGQIAEVIQFQAPRDRPVTAPRLIRAGVYPGARVSIRRIGRGFDAPAGIAITSPGRVGPVGADPDGYTLLAPRLTPAERKLAPLLGAFLEQNAARLGLTPTSAHRAAAGALRKSIGFPEMLSAGQ
jgi:hypothetical protein